MWLAIHKWLYVGTMYNPIIIKHKQIFLCRYNYARWWRCWYWDTLRSWRCVVFHKQNLSFKLDQLKVCIAWSGKFSPVEYLGLNTGWKELLLGISLLILLALQTICKQLHKCSMFILFSIMRQGHREIKHCKVY